MREMKLAFAAILLLSISTIIYHLWPYLLCALILIGTLYLCFVAASKMKQSGYSLMICVTVPLLVTLVGFGVGFAYLGEPFLLPIGSIPLMSMVIYSQVQQRRLVAHYQRNIAQLVKP